MWWLHAYATCVHNVRRTGLAKCGLVGDEAFPCRNKLNEGSTKASKGLSPCWAERVGRRTFCDAERTNKGHQASTINQCVKVAGTSTKVHHGASSGRKPKKKTNLSRNRTGSVSESATLLSLSRHLRFRRLSHWSSLTFLAIHHGDAGSFSNVSKCVESAGHGTNMLKDAEREYFRNRDQRVQVLWINNTQV